MSRGLKITLLAGLLAALMVAGLFPAGANAQERRTLWWGRSGNDVALVQDTLRRWGYYDGPVSGFYGWRTLTAVASFQLNVGLPPDGIVGRSTWAALGYPSGRNGTAGAGGGGWVNARSDELDLLARVITGEASGEPYDGQVAVASVILNRVRHPSFPNSIAGVIYEPWAFESVGNGLIWSRPPLGSAYRAASDALNGWDPTYGAIFFWNPYKPVNWWIWTRQIITQIGSHVFAR